MTYEMYRNVFMVCAAAAGTMAFVSILLFVLLRIPSVIGDLTGITAKRGIEQIQSKNSQTASSKKLKRQKNQEYNRNTERLQVAEKETTLLSAAAGNEDLQINMPAVQETTVLQPEFGVLEDITILHTEEEI